MGRMLRGKKRLAGTSMRERCDETEQRSSSYPPALTRVPDSPAEVNPLAQEEPARTVQRSWAATGSDGQLDRGQRLFISCKD
jgi:hypothetical protein